MPTFEITRPQDSVVLDAAGNGKIPFTITNLTSRPIRARVELHPDNPGDASLLQMEGESERSFSGKDTQSLNVLVRAQRSTAPGEHKFFLKVIDLELPDDNYVESQSVSFTVPAREPAKFPWWIVIAAAVFIGLVIGGWYLFSGTKVQVDDYTGKPYADVSTLLTNEGLKPVKGDEVTYSTKPDGVVVDQTIKNTAVPKATTITFIVTAQHIKVPRVKGLQVDEAKTDLSNAGFIIDKAISTTNQTVDDAASVNRVIAQSPDPDSDPNASAFASGPIALTVGVPRENGTLGSYVGQGRCQAQGAVNAAGFNWAVVYNPALPGANDSVVAQDHPAGSLPKGTTVTLTVTGNTHVRCYILLREQQFYRGFAIKR